MAKKTTKKNNQKKIILFIICLLFFLTVSVFLLNGRFSLFTRAAGNVIDISWLSKNSEIINEGSVVSFYLHQKANQAPFFKINSTGISGIMEFLRSNPSYIMPNKSSLIPFLSSSKIKKLLPENISSSLVLFRESPDKKLDDYYLFYQYMDGIQVYGSSLLVAYYHADMNTLSANLLNNKSVVTGDLSQDEANSLAQASALQECKISYRLKVIESKEYILNKKLLGISEDDNNYHVYAVTVVSDSDPTLFAKKYFVKLKDGEIIFSEDLVRSDLVREIYSFDYPGASGNGSKEQKICQDYQQATECKKNCRGLMKSSRCEKASCCSYFQVDLKRGEGDPPITVADEDAMDKEMNDAYEYVGKANSFFRQFGLNAFADKTLKVFFDFDDKVNNVLDCPSSHWYDNSLFLCRGMVSQDILLHEMAHGVIEDKNPSLVYQRQEWAVIEGIADLFTTAFSSRWEYGDDTIIGPEPIRNLSHPEQTVSRSCQDYQANPLGNCAGAQPDRLSSQNYDCNGEWFDNSGVLTKAFYLMSAGGSFNNCRIKGIGKENVYKIMAKYLDKYFVSPVNFKKAYYGIIYACYDVYGPTSDRCREVENAMQATEMDQQPLDLSTGVFCDKDLQPKLPLCAMDNKAL